MDHSEKLENSLNMALDASIEQRGRSQTLRTGYDGRTDTWELIVKYSGEELLLSYAGERGIRAELLLAGYAVLTVPEAEIEALVHQPFLEYAEQPKRLFFADLEGRTASCADVSGAVRGGLTGKGVLAAVIDSGIDLYSQDFRNEDGSTRVLFYNDQRQKKIFDKEQIDAFLRRADGVARGAADWMPERGGADPSGLNSVGGEWKEADETLERGRQDSAGDAWEAIENARDSSGHGTAVAGIAAGNGRASGGLYKGMAPEAELLVVKLAPDAPNSFPRTTELMRAVTWVVQTARALNRPAAVNISIGNTYGAHDGTSLIERFLDQAAEVGRCCICVGSGNEGVSGGHAVLQWAQGEAGARTAELAVGSYETGLTLQVWKRYTVPCTVELTAPDGRVFRVSDSKKPGSAVFETDAEFILAYCGGPSPYSVNQEYYFDFIPKKSYLGSGIWQIRAEKEGEEALTASLYLPSAAVRSDRTRFLKPTPSVTLTIPSTAARVITVGAYDTRYDAYADFSGRGFVLENRGADPIFGVHVKPDLAAPGVGIVSDDAMIGYGTFTGTSFAAPFVTGAAALLMEWGIVRGNDPYLYGEKVKAYLQRGARRLPGFQERPNASVGYGALCVDASLPE